MYNRLQLLGLFPFKSKQEIAEFWSELYLNDYKHNLSYYESIVKNAMPELEVMLSEGERIFDLSGPSEVFIEQLCEIQNQWDEVHAAYESYYNSVKDKLPECILKICDEKLREARVIDIGMPKQGVLVIQIDTRFTELSNKGIDQILLTFYGVKSIKTEGIIRLQAWQYSEVHISDVSAFELQILFEEGELAFLADEVECKFQNRFDNLFLEE